MQGPITVNATLAKGLAKRSIREATATFQRQVEEAANRIPEGRFSLRRLYRNRRKAIETAFGPSIIFIQEIYEGKKRETQYYCWGAEEDRIIVYLICVVYRDLALTILQYLVVSRHATERIFERLNTTDIYIVQEELTKCAIMSIPLFHSGYQIKDPDRGIRYQTLHGTAVLKRDDILPWHIVTWFAAPKGVPHTPTREQEEMLEEATALLKAKHSASSQ